MHACSGRESQDNIPINFRIFLCICANSLELFSLPKNIRLCEPLECFLERRTCINFVRIALILNVEGFYYVELEYYTISRTRRFRRRKWVAVDSKYFRTGKRKWSIVYALVVVMGTCPQAIQLVMITTAKLIHGFPFLSLWAAGAPATMLLFL